MKLRTLSCVSCNRCHNNVEPRSAPGTDSTPASSAIYKVISRSGGGRRETGGKGLLGDGRDGAEWHVRDSCDVHGLWECFVNNLKVMELPQA